MTHTRHFETNAKRLIDDFKAVCANAGLGNDGSTLKAIKIPFPNSDLEKQYSEKVKSVSRQQQNLEAQNQELTELRDWLLPMLMNGQVTVT